MENETFFGKVFFFSPNQINSKYTKVYIAYCFHEPKWGNNLKIMWTKMQPLKEWDGPVCTDMGIGPWYMKRKYQVAKST